MMSSTAFNGNGASPMPTEQPNSLSTPYILAVTSHKGGTGRTTLALALAWLWGQRGFAVTLIDADPIKAASLVAFGPGGFCPWDNVNVIVARQGVARIPPKQDIIIIDTPPATEPLAQKVFQKANGVIICSLADSLALNTLPAATKAVIEAQATNETMDLLGIVVNIFNPADLAQTRCLSLLRGAPGGLFVEPPIPLRSELREWPRQPGSNLPDSPAMPSLRSLADTFRDQMAEAGWDRLARRKGDSVAHSIGS
jgi:cellulose biosynthesis protein BcsQ